MKITKYLLVFALVATLLSLCYREVLSFGVAHRYTGIIGLASVLYFVTMFAAGWITGYKEARYLPIADIGFRWHLTTYLIFMAVGILWYTLGYAAPNESIVTLWHTALSWGILLFIHFIFYLWRRHKSIKGLKKEEIFE